MHKDMQPTMEIDIYGAKYWYLNGRLHRTDGPAVKWPNGNKAWRVDGLLHRTNGPAIEFADGTNSWYLNGKKLSFEEWLHQTPGLTNKQKTFYRLQYA